MNRYEKRRMAIDSAIREQIDEYKSIYKQAESEDRDPTDDERLDIESHLKNIETLKEEKGDVEQNIKTLEHVEDLGRKLGPSGGALDDVNDVQVVRGGEPIDRMVKSIGEQFTESKGFKSFHDRMTNGGKQQGSTGSVEMKAGTLSEAPTLGAGLIPVPQVVPGVVQTLYQRLTIENLLDSGQATTNSIRYIVEGTATSGAAGVAEAATKPPSALGLDVRDEPIKKIATTLIVTDEMMEDVAQVQSYVNGRLSVFVANRVEASLINGAGTNDLVGLLQGGRAINTLANSGTDNPADTLFKAINGVRGSAQLEPDSVLISPASFQKIRLLRDAAGGTVGQYMGGGPFQYGPYGNGPDPSASNQITGTPSGPNDFIWTKPLYVTNALSAGSALVITRSAAQVWSRSGLTVEASNSGFVGGQDLFTSNLVAIRAERRLGLAVYRPAAFCLVTGL